MEQFLKYFYNIYVEKVQKNNNNYYFYYNKNLYYILKCNRTIKELEEIFVKSKELYNLGIPVSEIIINMQGQILTKYEEDNYFFLKIIANRSVDYNINDIINFQNRLNLTKDKLELYRNNWGLLWEEKVDYFEYQIKELGINKPIILNSFSYFIGLAENAISIANIWNLNSKNSNNVVLSHKRIKYPNLEVDFLNPLTFIFDLSIRDISEYFKSMFFYTDEKKTFNELKTWLYRTTLSDYEANMLYARLLYPSYYFDIYEKVIEDKINEEELIDIINKVNDYENFLKDVYYELSKKNKIEKVDWLIKKRVTM